MLMNWFGMKLIPDFKRNLNSIIYQHRACNIHIFLALTLTLPSSINAYISTSFFPFPVPPNHLFHMVLDWF